MAANPTPPENEPVAADLTTAWMWLAGDELRGLSLDLATASLRWHDAVGCHCADEEYEDQSLADYRQAGPPPWVGPLPADIASEVEAAVAYAAANSPS